MWDDFRALAAITTLAISSLGGAASAQDVGRRIDTYLEEQVEANGIPGLTAAVVRDGAILYEGAFGVRRPVWSLPATDLARTRTPWRTRSHIWCWRHDRRQEPAFSSVSRSGTRAPALRCAATGYRPPKADQRLAVPQDDRAGCHVLCRQARPRSSTRTS